MNHFTGGRVTKSAPALAAHHIVDIITLDRYRYTCYQIGVECWIACLDTVRDAGLSHGPFSEEEATMFLGARIAQFREGKGSGVVLREEHHVMGDVA